MASSGGKKIIGIDLGTSNSAAAAMSGGRPAIIPSAEGTSLGGKAFPSYVAFTKEGEMLVGEPARRQAVSNPEGTVTAIKRKMGTDYKAKIGGKEMEDDKRYYQIIEAAEGECPDCGMPIYIPEFTITCPCCGVKSSLAIEGEAFYLVSEHYPYSGGESCHTEQQ